MQKAIIVTIEGPLPEIYAGNETAYDMSEEELEALVREDVQPFLESARWKVRILDWSNTGNA